MGEGKRVRSFRSVKSTVSMLNLFKHVHRSESDLTPHHSGLHSRRSMILKRAQSHDGKALKEKIYQKHNNFPSDALQHEGHKKWRLLRQINKLGPKTSNLQGEVKDHRNILDKGHWVPNHEAKRCMLCLQEFHMLYNRKHHCRLCGSVVCENCSTGRDFFEGSSRKQRICDLCVDETASSVVHLWDKYSTFRPRKPSETDNTKVSPLQNGNKKRHRRRGRVESGLGVDLIRHAFSSVVKGEITEEEYEKMKEVQLRFAAEAKMQLPELQRQKSCETDIIFSDSEDEEFSESNRFRFDSLENAPMGTFEVSNNVCPDWRNNKGQEEEAGLQRCPSLGLLSEFPDLSLNLRSALKRSVSQRRSRVLWRKVKAAYLLSR
eukprot:g4115.t1